MTTRFLKNVSLTAVLVIGCGTDINQDQASAVTPPPPDIQTATSAVKIDPATGELQTCSGPSDESCNAQGPGQRLACDADLMCRYYESDEDCTYPGLEGGPKSCEYVACADESECDLSNPDTNHLSATCIFTETSFQAEVPGVCFFAYAECAALAGTPCEEIGVVYCDEGECACTVSGDMTKAVTELCDNVDNDCDGVVDEDFALGVACDGADTDLCQHGTNTCAGDQLAVECVNESIVNILEICDGTDNDCDGATDEGFPLGEACDGADSDLCKNGKNVCALQGDGMSVTCDEQGDGIVEICNGVDDDCDEAIDEGFPTLGQACDGADVDMCQNGMLVCSEDGTGVVCNEKIADGAVEGCNGQDDDCDGAVDEGCDDDNDSWCDSSMNVAVPGATCQPGDCDDEGGAEVNPGMEEKCSTPFDDNCDGDTEHLADGVTPACDSCANALALDCGVEYVIDMGSEPNAANSIASYQCWTNVGAKTLKTAFNAPEVIIVPDADPGTEFSLQIMNAGTGTIAARLHGSCEPNGETSAVTAYQEGSAVYNGTCAGYSTTSVGGGIVGEDFVALDAASAKTVTVKFICD